MGRKKKIHLDENGNPCKYWQTPEAKAKAKAYREKPENKAKAKAYREKPEIKARRQTPEFIAKEKARRQTPEFIAKEKARWQTPEVKAKAKARKQTPEYKAKERAKDKARQQTPERKAFDRVRNKARRQTSEYKAKERARRQTSEYKAKYQAYIALRRAAKLQGKVLLNKAQRKAIDEIYTNRPKGWHVDHIAPLQGEKVSGFHVPENLQYLPASINCMKGNRWDDSWASHTMDTPSLEEKIKAYSLVQV